MQFVQQAKEEPITPEQTELMQDVEKPDLATLFQAPSEEPKKAKLPKDPLHINHFLSPETLDRLQRPPKYDQFAWKLHSKHLGMEELDKFKKKKEHGDFHIQISFGSCPFFDQHYFKKSLS